MLKSPPCELHKLNPYLTISYSLLYSKIKKIKKIKFRHFGWRHNKRTKLKKKKIYILKEQYICLKKTCRISDPQVVYFFYKHSLRDGGQKCVFSSRHIGNFSLVAKGLKGFLHIF